MFLFECFDDRSLDRVKPVVLRRDAGDTLSKEHSDIAAVASPVSYTHLTLPTKRIV